MWVTTPRKLSKRYDFGELKNNSESLFREKMSKADPAREQTIQFKSIKSPPLEGNQFITSSYWSITLIGLTEVPIQGFY